MEPIPKNYKRGTSHARETRTAQFRWLDENKHLPRAEMILGLIQQFGLGEIRAKQVIGEYNGIVKKASDLATFDPEAAAREKRAKAAAENIADILTTAKLKLGDPSAQPLTRKEVYALATEGVSLADMAASQGLSETEFKQEYEKDFIRGSAVYRIKLQSTSAKVGLVDENASIIGKLREFEFGDGRSGGGNVNIYMGRDGLIDKIKSLLVEKREKDGK